MSNDDILATNIGLIRTKVEDHISHLSLDHPDELRKTVADIDTDPSEYIKLVAHTGLQIYLDWSKAGNDPEVLLSALQAALGIAMVRAAFLQAQAVDDAVRRLP